MHRRHGHINIPTEIIRTIITIAETRSYSKAADRLGLSQPAISAQIKRFQVLVGGAIFSRVAGGVALTDRGNAVLGYARKLLEANDQILAIGGVDDSRQIRLGLSSLYVEQYLSTVSAQDIKSQVHISSEQSSELVRAFADGHLDIVCLLDPPTDIGECIVEWRERFVWVRRRDFVLSPGAPIPLIGWPGGAIDLPVSVALERAGLTHRIVFSSADHHVRMTAAAAGLGLMALPAREAVAPLVVAKEYYLPALPTLRAGICVRSGVDLKRHSGLVDQLRALVPAAEAPESSDAIIS